jgi:alkylated DNA repair dioxygenase AlkB
MSRKRKAKDASYQPKLSSFILGKSPQKPPDRSYCECPICGLSGVPVNMMNNHIDICLSKMEKQTIAESIPVAVDSSKNVSTNSIVEGPQDSTTRILPNKDVKELSITYQGQIPGLLIIYNFISEEEETFLMDSIENDGKTPWHESSFNGDTLSKSFGVKTQFGLPNEERCVRKNNPALGEHDIPEYLAFLPVRLKMVVAGTDKVPIELKSFVPNECNCNCYLKSRKHYLKPHYDDRALSGPLLMNLSMGCDAFMTYLGPNGAETAVLLPRRCLQIVIGEARWTYKHSIKANDILGEKRISVTWRHSQSRQKGMRGVSSVSSAGGHYTSSSAQDAQQISIKSMFSSDASTSSSGVSSIYIDQEFSLRSANACDSSSVEGVAGDDDDSMRSA